MRNVVFPLDDTGGPSWEIRDAYGFRVFEDPGQRDLRLVLDQPGVRCGDRVGAHVVLLNMRQPVPGQGRDCGLGDWGEPDVAALPPQNVA
jgi:hypothetical protein